MKTKNLGVVLLLASFFGQVLGLSSCLALAAPLDTLQSPLDGHADGQDAGETCLQFKNGTLHVHAQFEKAPTSGEESILHLQVVDPVSHEPIETEEQLSVRLWMPAMGHGSAPTVVERVLDSAGKASPGEFRVRKIYFMMGGLWEVQVTLKDAQGNREMQKFEVTLEAGHGGHHHDGLIR